jgi:hypothetical protein
MRTFFLAAASLAMAATPAIAQTCNGGCLVITAPVVVGGTGTGPQIWINNVMHANGSCDSECNGEACSLQFDLNVAGAPSSWEVQTDSRTYTYPGSPSGPFRTKTDPAVNGTTPEQRDVACANEIQLIFELNDPSKPESQELQDACGIQMPCSPCTAVIIPD